MGAKTVVLALALAATKGYATPDGIAMTHMTSAVVVEEIPVVKHKKEKGGDYLKGSPLYKKREPLPLPDHDRTKPSIAVIIGAILVGLALLVCSGFINKGQLVQQIGSYREPKMPSSQTRLQSQRLESPRYNVPVQPPAPYGQMPMPQSGTYLPGPAPMQSGPVYVQGQPQMMAPQMIAPQSMGPPMAQYSSMPQQQGAPQSMPRMGSFSPPQYAQSMR